MLRMKSFLSEDEELEMKVLKKRKLHCKDIMEGLKEETKDRDEKDRCADIRRSFEAGGGRHALLLSGGCGAQPDGCPLRIRHKPDPRAPRAGGGPRGGRVRALHGPCGRLPRHVRSRRHQHGHRHCHGVHGFHSHGDFLRPGQYRPYRQRRLPGGGHRRHHETLHQAQLPGEGREGHGPHHKGGLFHRQIRPPRTGPRGHTQGRVRGILRFQVPGEGHREGLPAELSRPSGTDKEGHEAHRVIEKARALYGRRHHQLERVQGAPRARGEALDPGDEHAHGPRRLPRRP